MLSDFYVESCQSLRDEGRETDAEFSSQFGMEESNIEVQDRLMEVFLSQSKAA